jgi:hypothetical protein
MTATAEIARETVSAANRVGRVRLTRGNVGGSRQPGNKTPETGLAGWGGRIRTSAWRNQKPSLSTENQSLSLKEAVNPAPGNQRLTDILSNLFRPHRRVSRMPGDRGKEHRAAGVI